MERKIYGLHYYYHYTTIIISIVFSILRLLRTYSISPRKQRGKTFEIPSRCFYYQFITKSLLPSSVFLSVHFFFAG